ncbi:MAG: hypothetical protein Crog4KO_19060 [Crocinitomicaceae bacterium]
MSEQNYIVAQGISYKGTLKKIKKNDAVPLQAFFEAFTNSLESIKISERDFGHSAHAIIVTIHLKMDLFSDQDAQLNFDRITVFDTGVGFNDQQFEQLINLNEDSKGFNNKGSGRLQYLHTFDKTTIDSTFLDEDSETGAKRRELTLSKSEAFLKHNAIIRVDNEENAEANNVGTILTFSNPLFPKDERFFAGLTPNILKKELIERYLAYFCEHRNHLPTIQIQMSVNGEEGDPMLIRSDDVPSPDREERVSVNYSSIDGTGKIVRTSKVEEFNLKAFIIPEEQLAKNQLLLISKGEVAKKIKLDNLTAEDSIEGSRYLFLLSGEYINEHDGDTRGQLTIVTEKEFKAKNKGYFFATEEVLLDHIEDETNTTILRSFDEIQELNAQKIDNIQELKDTFLLNDEVFNSLKIGINDSNDQILKKVYEADAKISAKKDAAIKYELDSLDELDPADESYQEDLQSKINHLVRLIPLQDRTALSKYVARRKLVLELFGKILDSEKQKLDSGGTIDEAVLHNLIFKQSSTSSQYSDLWLINEEFIYFDGVSEKQLRNVEIDGTKLFKEEFSAEEDEYLNSGGERRLQKRPDILLFPNEGKCIIIEFKAPGVNAADHLNQTDRYANFILNYTHDEFIFNSFHSYLIGENIQDRDVRGTVSQFERSVHFDFWFRPSTKVQSFSDNRSNGEIYSEVIKYSTLLERAKLRNKIFIDKLMGHNPQAENPTEG